MSYDPDTRRLTLEYHPQGGARTGVLLPEFTYGKEGACPSVIGSAWRIQGDRLLLSADPGASQVKVRVAPGHCGASSPRCARGPRFGLTLRGRRADPPIRARV